MQAQTVIPVVNAKYNPGNFTDGSAIVLTVTHNADFSTTFNIGNSPIGPLNNIILYRHYPTAADTVGACPGAKFSGLPLSQVPCGAWVCATAWDVSLWGASNSCESMTSATIKWNDYELAVNNSPAGCVRYMGYAANGGALVTDGVPHLYSLFGFSTANMKQFKVSFEMTLPLLPSNCPGQVIVQAPASVTSPAAPAKTTGKPPKK